MKCICLQTFCRFLGLVYPSDGTILLVGTGFNLQWHSVLGLENEILDGSFQLIAVFG